MFDVYQHKMRPQFRLIMLEGKPVPAGGKPESWRKARTVSTIWPEAQEQIDKTGFYCYKTVAWLEEIELTGPS